MKNEEKFGQYLRRLREAAGVTQLVLASFCKISKQYISDIEKGNNPPPDRDELLDKIAICLKFSTEQKAQLKDHAAMERGDVAADIKAILITNPEEIKRLRRQYAKQ